MSISNLPLARKVAFIFSLFAIIMLSSIVTVLYFQKGASKVDGVRIDIAGRNRMLSQKAAFIVTLLQSRQIDQQKELEKLESVLNLHHSSYLLLRNGGEANGANLDGSYDEFTKEYDAISIKWKEYNRLIDRILEGNTSSLSQLSVVAQELLVINNNLVQALVRRYNERNEYYQNLFIAQGLISGLVLVFGFVLVKRSIVSPTNKILSQIERLNSGHFGDLSELGNTDEFGSISSGLNQLSNKINGLVKGLEQISGRIVGLSGSIQSSSQVTNENASSQASSSEEISASLEELDSTAEMNAQRSSMIATNSLSSLKQLNEVKTKSEEVYRALNEIGNNIKLVEGIASETNMLALNAAVEASRAGENGKGFSVISKEIRALADSAKEASEKIIGLAEICHQHATSNNELIDLHVNSFSDFMEEVKAIDQASQEQKMGINQINLTINSLNDVSQSNAQMASELFTSFNELNSLTKEMNDRVERITKNGSIQND